jgi:hypothetical protein
MPAGRGEPGQLVPPFELAFADFARHLSLSARQRTAGAYLWPSTIPVLSRRARLAALATTLLCRAAVEDASALEPATTAVERIRGSVLLISAGDDQVWPSVELSEIAMARLRSAGHPYPDEHSAFRRPPPHHDR